MSGLFHRGQQFCGSLVSLWVFAVCYFSYSLVVFQGVHVTCFIHSPAGRRLDCFQGVSITNEATVNIHLPVFVWTYASFLLGRFLEMALLGSMKSSFLTF